MLPGIKWLPRSLHMSNLREVLKSLGQHISYFTAAYKKAYHSEEFNTVSQNLSALSAITSPSSHATGRHRCSLVVKIQW